MEMNELISYPNSASTRDADAMPLSIKGPFVLGGLPGALRGDGKNGEF